MDPANTIPPSPAVSPAPSSPTVTAAQPATIQPLQTPPQEAGKTEDSEHINQEMYKRNLELAERNKTLSLLRKLDELILSSVTDIKETAEKVTTLLVEEAEFRLSAIFLLDEEKKNLALLAFSKPQSLTPEESENTNRFNMISSFPMSITNNLVVQTILEKKVKTTNTLIDVLQMGTLLGADDALLIQKAASVSSTLLFPVIVREEVIGAMMVSQKKSIGELNEYQWDLLERLVAVIGIALDNALLYNEVQSTNQKLKVLDRLKDEFVSLASHELRTPMTAIKSYLWLFLEDNRAELNDKQKMYIERAYTSTDRLINLVNDMLNVSRIESGRLIINKKPFSLIQLISETIGEIMPTIQEQKKQLLFHKPETDMPFVEADPDKIKQVLLNLIGNSIKFTPDGGNITISVSQVEDMIITSIKDTGKGILQEDLPKLFKKFSIIGTTTVLPHGAQSTGLGLYISKAIIELHGGKVWAESEGENKGASFSFTLRKVK